MGKIKDGENNSGVFGYTAAKTLSERYPDYRKRDTVISRDAKMFVEYLAREGYSVEQMKTAVRMAGTYIDIEVSKSHIQPPQKLRCTYSGNWEVDDDGNPKKANK